MVKVTMELNEEELVLFERAVKRSNVDVPTIIREIAVEAEVTEVYL